MWFGEKPNLSNLKVFGCKAFSHVPKEKRHGKLAPHAKEYVFVGYGFNHSYRLFDIESKKIVMSRSVVFNEDAPGLTTDQVSSIFEKEQVVCAPTIANLSPLSRKKKP